MPQRGRRFWILTGLVLVWLAVHGCLGGPRPDIVSETKKPESRYSSAEIREMTLDRPFMLSGDYFRTRPGQAAGNEPSAAPGRQAGQAPARMEGRLLKVAWLHEPGKISASSAGRIFRAAVAARPQGIHIVGPDRIFDLLYATGCLQETDLSCMAGHLVLYPGVRMLVMVKRLELPETFPGRLVLECRVFDAGLDISCRPLEMSQTVEDPGQVRAFLEHAAGRIFSFLQARAGVMPPHCRVFSVENDRVYISAGRLHGLSPGDVLDVTASGRIVRTPAGVPVAWIPDSPKGRIRVEMLVREDVAACVRVEGEPPRTGDFVLLPASG